MVTSPPRRRLLAGLTFVLALAPAGSCANYSQAEADRIAEMMAVEPGQTVADVGAGDGEWAVDLARRVGPFGQVWATEVDEDLVEKIRRRATDESLLNLTPVLGGADDTALPEACCDAILLRLVYHHFTEPAAMRASLRRALKPGGRLVIVDIDPQRHWRDLEGVPDRGGHGIPVDDLVAELIGDGFELESTHLDWKGDDDRYCAVFRLAAP